MTAGDLNPKVKNPNSVNECRRTIPRGLRTMLASKRPLDDMSDAALRWLQRHDLIRPNKRGGRTRAEHLDVHHDWKTPRRRTR